MAKHRCKDAPCPVKDECRDLCCWDCPEGIDCKLICPWVCDEYTPGECGDMEEVKIDD